SSDVYVPSSVTSEESSVVSSTSSSQSSSQKLDYSSNPSSEPYIARQSYLNYIGDIYSVWKQYRGDGQTIAVIDEGFESEHEDFTFNDGTSKVSPDSASFVTSGSNTTTSVGIKNVKNGEASHGTFCAGVAAAGINGKGVVGIAPNAKLLLLKTDRKPKSIAKAFHYAADHGATVVSISIGSYYNYDGDLVNDGSDLGTVFDEPVKYCYDKGVPVISAGGNGGLDNQPTEYTFPGCVDNVIGVGGLAANSSTKIWSGSSYNSSPQYRFIDVFAPAENMYGCCNYGGKKYDSGWNGTSFAAPQVAGMAALYLQKNPNATARDFENALYASCHKIDNSGHYGYGRVDVGKLMGVTN
ncbi:MAG: S8 family serine peptidase, partial [Bacilli bacterium]|nr:S8 family serine peptidase [Bacilli bacterium]